MTTVTMEGLFPLEDQAHKEKIVLLLKELRLPSARRTFMDFYRQAQESGWSPLTWLNAILECEVVERSDRRRASRRRESNLPPGKTLETFDFSAVKGVTKTQVHALFKDTRWTSEAENLLFFGPSGSGKTHLIAAIGHGLIDNGSRVYYSPTSTMLQRLQEAREGNCLPAMLKKLERFDVLILDDIGYADKEQYDTGLLFELIADRYESRSLVVASNKAFAQWGDVFSDNARCVAAIDRLVHHGTILELQGESYRRKVAEKRTQAASRTAGRC